MSADAPRAIVVHVDDLGSSHGANVAFLDLAARGLATCGSVMVPGPWFAEIAAAARADPELDLGVHLTLTSEWDTCRWAPISTTSRASGLIDDDGYFWRDLDSLRRHMAPQAAEAELRAQIERAIAAGIRPTHLDTHMGVAMLPGLLDAHIALGREYGALPVIPRAIPWAPDPDAYQAAVARLDALGAPVIEHVGGTMAVAPDRLAEAWRGYIAALPPGVTHLALHCTAPGDFSAMAPRDAGFRYAEYELFASGRVRALCDEAGVAIIGMREIQREWLSVAAPRPSAAPGAAPPRA